MIRELIQKYSTLYKNSQVNVYFAPGRVNLIGEHTDYNGGHVFPCALDIGTYVAAGKRNDSLIRFYSENFDDLGIIKADIRTIQFNKADDWANYPKGVIKVLQDAGYKIETGLDLYFYGNLPNGAGLSSSASIEMVTAVMINDLFDLNIDQISLVKAALKSENSFMGVNCGIMDQFASGMGKEHMAILLDTNNLHYSYVPLKTDGYSIIITNTNKKRALTDSKYNERRSECETALTILQKRSDIHSLGDLSISQFENIQNQIEDPNIRKRAKHAVYENQRTIEAEQALNAGDLVLFGKLMNESHVSLRDDYEVTGKELDLLANLAWEEEGVIGSRMTGAGFGGCTVSIVKNDKIESFKKHVGDAYTAETRIVPSFYVVNPGNGAGKLL